MNNSTKTKYITKQHFSNGGVKFVKKTNLNTNEIKLARETTLFQRERQYLFY